MRSAWILVAAAALLVACGGGDDDAIGSGLDRSRQVGSLSDDERMQECAWGLELQGGPGSEHDCGDGVILVAPTLDECVANSHDNLDGCDLTVGQLEDCIESIDGDICVAFNTPVCTAFRACLGAD